MPFPDTIKQLQESVSELFINILLTAFYLLKLMSNMNIVYNLASN